MAITYKLYCRKCYTTFTERLQGRPIKSRPYSSYFTCSQCGFETDRGYAVEDQLPLEIDEEQKTAVSL